MAKKKESKGGVPLGLESQNDMAYLTGDRPVEDEEKQVKTPSPRRTVRATKPRRRKDEEGD